MVVSANLMDRVLFFFLVTLAAACGGRATNHGDGDPEPGSSGGGPAEGTGGDDGTGGAPEEDVPPNVAFCREYLTGKSQTPNEGPYYSEEQAIRRCDACADTIVNCAAVQRCIPLGICSPTEEGDLECTCTEGAYCLDAIDNPERSNCPVIR